MNPLMHKIALMNGISRPHYICDKYPEYDFNNVSLKRIQQTFIGGWINDGNINSIKSYIIKADELTPKNNLFYIGFGYGHSDSKKKLISDAINELIKEKTIKARHIFINDKILSLPMLLFHMRTSSHIYLHSDYPKTELINDLINSNSPEIINYTVAESSMLSMAKSSKLYISGDIDAVNFSSIKNIEPFTYKMFSYIFSDILKKY